jgi:hypothetical protein
MANSLSSATNVSSAADSGDNVGVSAATLGSCAADASTAGRLAYSTPVIRRLGSVRELTLGTSGGPMDFGKQSAGPM